MGIMLVTRFRLGLSHLRERKFKQISGYINPFCNCGIDFKFYTHFLLQRLSYINERHTLMSNLTHKYLKLDNFWQMHFW